MENSEAAPPRRAVLTTLGTGALLAAASASGVRVGVRLRVRWSDTTSPRAIGRTYARLVVGGMLPARDRRRLTGWLMASTTIGERFRAGLPADWVLIHD
ncbi:hypothetical protein J4032_35590 [Streptomyces formicae]|uniref:Secreted protein n=1 Tax=Streptomyces formicae TaxID=1616117 RepID=A0ABY3WWQ4_9ACTN|nr:hypothetical protein J4032_35590 [Streptomyces formicae]